MCYLCGFFVLTDGSDELVEAAEWKQRLWKLPQEQFESSGDHMDLLPLPVLQVQLLLCRDNKDTTKTNQSAAHSVITAVTYSKTSSTCHDITGSRLMNAAV